MEFIKIKDNGLFDMALTRQDAIDRCISLGKKFIEHFDKIYNDRNNNAFNHWAKEMKTWLNQVKEIKLKPKNNYILNGQLRDWFFTAGAAPEDFMLNPDDKELRMYDSFCEKLLSGKDIYNTLNELFELNIKDSYDYDEICKVIVKELYNKIKNISGIDGIHENGTGFYYKTANGRFYFQCEVSEFLEDSIKDANELVDKKKLALAKYLNIDPTELKKGYRPDIYEYNGEEYLVLTEDESYNEAHEQTVQLIDDIGLSLFNKHWLDTELEDNDILPDSIIDDEEFIDKYEFIEYIKSLTGLHTYDKLCELGIDVDELIDRSIYEDGLGHIISSYDGEQIELDNNLFAYRMN